MSKKKIFLLLSLPVIINNAFGQLKWINVDSVFGPLPSSVHVYKTTGLLDGKPNIAYFVEADLKDKNLIFAADTSHDRRLKPSQFFERNNPLVVVNCTFFSFETNRSLNAVIMNGKQVAFNQHSVPGRGKDTLTYRHPFGSVIGISKKREADIAWLYTDSTKKYPQATQWPIEAIRDSVSHHDVAYFEYKNSIVTRPHEGTRSSSFSTWKKQTAVGGGPVLLQNAEIKITNNEELKFAGKAMDDKHPRTAMGYTRNNKLIILVIEGRNPGKAEGATLKQEAQLLKDIGCWEALNLDGGGSSCMLINGKETIKVSDATGQRPVPAVFIIKAKK